MCHSPISTRSTSLDSTASIPEVASTPTLLFRVGEDLYGSQVAQAQEVIPLRPMTRIPGAPSFVRGLINMRGTIITVLDLAVRLDQARLPSEDGSILLVRHRGGDRVVGIVVDEVMDVRALSIDEGDSDRSMAGARSAITLGVAMLDDAAVVVLDLDVLISQVLHS
jgi:purine-binding chemotaxis protein CheW